MSFYLINVETIGKYGNKKKIQFGKNICPANEFFLHTVEAIR